MRRLRRCLLIALPGLMACATARAPTTPDPPLACDLAPHLGAVEAAVVEQRLDPTLQALAEGCPRHLGDLATAAARARGQSRGGRAQVLGQAASMALPAACATPDPTVAAVAISSSCPPPPGLELAPQVLADLDAGTYLYALAVRARLDGAAHLDAAATRLLDNLILAAALEGEAARGGASGTPPADTP